MQIVPSMIHAGSRAIVAAHKSSSRLQKKTVTVNSGSRFSQMHSTTKQQRHRKTYVSCFMSLLPEFTTNLSFALKLIPNNVSQNVKKKTRRIEFPRPSATSCSGIKLEPGNNSKDPLAEKTTPWKKLTLVVGGWKN